jgi:hypothetical protein
MPVPLAYPGKARWADRERGLDVSGLAECGGRYGRQRICGALFGE